jgi:Trypsin-co-occurring domain 1
VDTALYVVESPSSMGVVRFEVAPTSAQGSGEVKAVNAQAALRKIGDVLDEATRTIRAIGDRVAECVAEMPRRPDEFEIEFGVKVDGQVGAVVAALGSGAHFAVKLRWEATKPGDLDSDTQ